MKWPSSLVIFRHGQSAYNALRARKQADPDYQAFISAFKEDYMSNRTRVLAEVIAERYAPKTSDYQTPLTKLGWKQARAVGLRILDHVPAPDVILVSPYLRTHETLDGIMEGLPPDAAQCRVVVDDRIREQEHGLSLVYGDTKLFHTFHPEQKRLSDLQGQYWYQFPQGESVSMVRERIRSVLTMLIREYSGMDVWLVSHHLTKLSIRANLERLSPEEFIRIDRHEKPINCGVTVYHGNSMVGSDGKLILQDYNLKLY